MAKPLTCRYLSGTTLSYNVDNWRTVSTDGLMACGLTYGGTPSCLSLSDDPSNFTLFDPSVNSGYTLSGSCIWNGMLCGIVQSDLSVQCFKGGSSVRTLFSATTYRRVFCSNIGSLSKICAARKDGSAADCNQISINTNNETISTLNGQDGKIDRHDWNGSINFLCYSHRRKWVLQELQQNSQLHKSFG